MGTHTNDSFEKLIIVASLGLDIDSDDDVLDIRSYRNPMNPKYAYNPKTLRKEKNPVGPYIAISVDPDRKDIIKKMKENVHFFDWNSFPNRAVGLFKYPPELLR